MKKIPQNCIYCMDCMALMAKLPDGAVDMILTDPPYGIAYENQYTQKRHGLLQGDTGIDYERFARESYRILAENAHAYFFTRFDCYPHHYQCLTGAGFRVKNCLVIEKGTLGGIGDLQGSYANNSEWVIFCQKGRRVFRHTTLVKAKKKAGTIPCKGRNPTKEYRTRLNACWFGADYPKATYNSTWQKKHRICHPTIKNVACLEWLIQISSQPGELIFDGFMGVGSTALAAIRTHRNFLGAEIERRYYRVAAERIEKEREAQGKEGETIEG